MKVSIAAAVSVGAAVALLTAGCGGDKSSTASSSSSSSSTASSSAAASSTTSESAPAEAQDYSTLLIDAADIPGETFTAQEPIIDPGGAAGVATAFSNEGGTRTIGDTILVLSNEADAATALEGAKANLGVAVTGTPAPANVGSNSVLVAGTSPDGTKEVTVLLFTQGKAFTTIEFDSAAGDPVPPEAVLDIGGKQAQKIADGLG